MRHTKEPWRYEFGKDGHEVWAPHGETGSMRIAACGFAATFDKDNARRIIACVNACAGIPIEMLEAMPSGPAALLPMYARLEKQSDDLLAALDRIRSKSAALGIDAIFDEATEAIASVKGEPCTHSREIEHSTGDGTPVMFCPDCGRNEAQPARFSSDDTSAPAIVFYPAGSLGEAVDSEGGEA